MADVIYLDNNATTRVADEVVAAMMPFFTELYGNPSSMHTFGGQVGHYLKQARSQVASALGATPEEIVFTACGTEGDNTAIRSALESQPNKRHVITTKVEHPAVMSLLQDYEKRGYQVSWIDVDHDGRLDLEALKAAIRPDTALISTMWANNETGVVFPIEEIGELAHRHGVLFHTDAVQAVGKTAIDLSHLPVDYLVLSGHKLHAPKGVGALYVKKGAPFKPLLIGGHQEKGRRSGTENIASIVGLGVAISMFNPSVDAPKIAALRDKLENGLLATIPDSRLNGAKDLRLDNTANISFKHVEGEAILMLMSQRGICASSGSACASGSLDPSHVLRAMDVPFTFAHGSIRFSLSRYTTESEIDQVLEAMPPIISRLRELSPFHD